MAAKKNSLLKMAPLLDRDVSLVAFNERVFNWVQRADVPLLERLRFLCIVSSNLDELFEVRMAPHLTNFVRDPKKSTSSLVSFESLCLRIHALVERQYAAYNGELMTELAKQGVQVVAHGQRTAAQRKWIKDYFATEVQPLLVPVGLDPSHPFPQVASKSLNFIVRLKGLDAFGRENEIAIVKVPRSLPRFIAMPGIKGRKARLFVSISSVIRAHLDDLFPGRQVTEFSQFRVTRHSDLAVDEEEVKNLRTALRQGLQHRHYGRATRLEVSSGCSAFLSDMLLLQFNVPAQALFRVHGPVNLARLTQLIDLLDQPTWLFPTFTPGWPKQLVLGQSLFEQISKGDVMIHQPFESFDAVIELLREAVLDPDVLAIKQTIYRAGKNSELMRLLKDAVHRGKEVTAVVELKARFDEEANINYSEYLEAVGAQVVYGVVGLKTHAKMLLITRREGKLLKRYAHLSTGNYNASTARMYTDLSMMTADPALTRDVEQVFLHLASQSRLPKLEKIQMAPFHLQHGILQKIDEVAHAAASGKPAHITVKMNSLTDERLAKALMAAAQQGATIDLIIRGACIIAAQSIGACENIRLRSVIGRFLEHTRVFYFQSDQNQTVWLSSADFMSRNMLRRVEIAWPVDDVQLRARVLEECLGLYLTDTANTWEMRSTTQYEQVPTLTPVTSSSNRHDVHHTLMLKYGRIC
ncbi:Polyphosphate kinase [Betaproteobacteria bacterium MOLA814]|nr:Polyphosphate kinase [Betaproteobacteria bacterium MOLA814]